MQYNGEDFVIEINEEEFLIRAPWYRDEIYVSNLDDAMALIRAAHKWIAAKRAREKGFKIPSA